jgi:alpha-2-macroglobulin-like protein
MKTIKYILSVLLILFSANAFAQQNEYSVTKEKIYMQTNHIFFKPGEQLFYKIYVVKAKDQTPTDISKVVYVDVIAPSGTIVEKQTYPIIDGAAEGSFDFNENVIGGVYKLKVYTTWMRNESDSTFFTKEITVQKTIAPRILMKLDFPKKGYGAGDKVIADFSARNLNDEPIKFYTIKYTATIAGKQILTNTIKTNNEGKAEINVDLPKDLNSTDGLLNITIDYDAYTESISRSIPIVLNNIDLQFMPEGGTLVDNINSNIAFKALNEFGKPVDITGAIYDDKNNKIVDFESYKFGMGKFAFTPKYGTIYYAKITSPTNITKEYKLPQINNTGIVFTITQNKETVLLKINCSNTEECKIIGQTKNHIYYEEKLLLENGEQIITISKDLFPVGIAQFTLYTSNQLPVAERLIFLNESKNLQVKITTNKKQYAPREKVKLQILTTDFNGKAIPSNFSLSIVDDKLWTFADDKQNHILSWLLLNSELKGNIQEPTFYFKQEEAKALPALDLVMLTNGYRYFDFIEYVLQENKLKFSPDQNNILSGIIVNDKNEPVEAKLFLASNNANGKAMQIKTDKNGKFFFTDLTANQSYYLLSQSFKKEKIKINILQNGIGFNPIETMALNVHKEDDNKMPAIRTLAFAKQQAIKNEKEFGRKNMDINDLAMDNFKNKEMNEIVVVSVGYATRKRDMMGAVTVVNAKELLNFDRLDNALAGKVAGLQITANANAFGQSKITMRGIRSLTGNDQLIIVVDGVPSNSSFISQLNPNDINNVEVLKNASATAIFGSDGVNGAILVTTKKFRTYKNHKYLVKDYFINTQQFIANGTVYTIAKKYYAPKYETTKTEERTDFRETIYWNPTVQTDKDGMANIEFYNSDATTTFRAIAEGIGYNGVLGRTEKTYSVKNILSVDAKIPPYLTVGDKALLPLVIKNNSEAKTYLNIEIKLPEYIISDKYTKAITLEPNQSQEILIPIEAIKATKGTIQFIVDNDNNKEIIKLPIEATNKGFAVIETFSGNTSKEHSFEINKLIPGTLATKLKLFNNVEGQLLDGIESMLREPYGCFEQTSSSTYPNVFILKYLKESGKSNAEIEKKAMQYIEAGYKRLSGFETAQNGFEWFGKTPPHEALSAYGLLEFTDMQEFINVDKKMLARTKQFLLSRRDGKGGFKLSNTGYDQFRSVPNKIANIYIVYALTQAGIGNEIKLEYETAMKAAIQSNDGYQLAMMTIAANNMHNENDYNNLLVKLNDNYKKANLQSETSVVNSRDASLRVESLSLYAIALCREKNPKLALIAELISKILAEKSYYGYGSTQATVLALHAVVNFSKLSSKGSKDIKIDFVLNGKKPANNEFSITGCIEGKNNFSVKYIDEKETIPYNFEVAYNTFTPPNSEKASLHITTTINNKSPKIGETVRMQIAVQNKENILQPMAIAKIGIPAGLIIQPWQLKEMMEKNEFAYYEIFDNYLVIYWMGCKQNETKIINLDLKATIEGTYKAKASNTYLYYTPEHKNWADGEIVEIGH